MYRRTIRLLCLGALLLAGEAFADTLDVSNGSLGPLNSAFSITFFTNNGTYSINNGAPISGGRLIS